MFLSSGRCSGVRSRSDLMPRRWQMAIRYRSSSCADTGGVNWAQQGANLGDCPSWNCPPGSQEAPPPQGLQGQPPPIPGTLWPDPTPGKVGVHLPRVSEGSVREEACVYSSRSKISHESIYILTADGEVGGQKWGGSSRKCHEPLLWSNHMY